MNDKLVLQRVASHDVSGMMGIAIESNVWRNVNKRPNTFGEIIC